MWNMFYPPPYYYPPNMQNTDKPMDPVRMAKAWRKFLKEEKKEEKKEKKGISTFDLGMLFFALVPILGPALMLFQLGYLIKIAEILQHH